MSRDEEVGWGVPYRTVWLQTPEGNERYIRGHHRGLNLKEVSEEGGGLLIQRQSLDPG